MAEPRPRSAPAILGTLAVAAVLAAAWLAAPPMGTDLSAQVARADFFAQHGWASVDFRWYGGVVPHGYSLLSPPLMAWFGPRPVGAAAAIVSALVLVRLLLRTGARRPLLGGVLGAACFTGNLVSGRVTFALGVAIGLLALLALAPLLAPRPAAPARAGLLDVLRWTGVLALAALAAAASPVAGLFVGLAGTALLCHAWWAERQRAGEQRRRVGEGAPSRAAVAAAVGGPVLMLGAGVPIAVMGGWFGTGGWMNMSRADMFQAAGASLAVAALVPHRVVRVGALLSAAGVVAAYFVPTPVGLNATRLATLFALPLVGAYAVVPAWAQTCWRCAWRAASQFAERVRRRLSTRASGGRRRRLRPGAAVPPPARLAVAARPRGWRPVAWLTSVLVGLAVWQPPVVFRDLASAGDPTSSPEHYEALREELANREPQGRVEVVPTRNYWEAAHLDSAPLARGWLRQADLDRHPLFFDGSLDADSYQQWLEDNGVSYVVLPQAPVSWVGRPEAELIEEGLPYLDLVWEDDDWALYKVVDAPVIVDGPAVLLEMTPQSIVFEATEADAEVLVRVRWSRRLAVIGDGEACLAPAGEWTEVQVSDPGEYEVTGVIARPGPRCG